MKKILIFALLICCFVFTSCSPDRVNEKAQEEGEKTMYENITQDEAKKIMDSAEDYIILDVREKEEYNEKHIPGAVLLPLGDVENMAEDVIDKKDKLILVYCRSGRRSKIAAEALAKLGYTNIKEFGGIIDWKYETE